MKRVRYYLWVTLALIFLGVSWMWDGLREIVAWFVQILPLERVKQAVARFVQRLPAYPTLAIFLVPLVLLEPMKILALWFLAKKQWWAGVSTYVATDLLRLALVSFLFEACKEKLLSIGWFNWLYVRFVAAHEWANEKVAPIKAAIRQALADAGLLGTRGKFLRKLRALWRHARVGGFRGASG